MAQAAKEIAADPQKRKHRKVRSKYDDRSLNAAFLDELRCWLGLGPLAEDTGEGRHRKNLASAKLTGVYRRVLTAASNAQAASTPLRPGRLIQRSEILRCVVRGWLHPVSASDTRLGFKLTDAGKAAMEGETWNDE
jgi:hypothetical protein